MEIRGPYKDRALQILRERNVPVETIIDVGVCRGTPELMKVWPDRLHLLFEPVEEFSAAITQHYRKIQHELHHVAVGDADGTISLKVSSVVPGMEISHSGMVAGNPGTDPRLRQVRKVTLDAFLKDRNDVQPYLLKIDIDGHELQVIEGAQETLKKCSIVIVECQKSHLVDRIAAVQAAGFDLFDLAEPCYYDKVFWQCDAIFLRNDIARSEFKQLKGMLEPGMYEMFR